MDNAGREGEQLEFKINTTELDDGIVSLSAMLNKSCRGEVLFGVRDNGDIVGMDIGKNTLRTISERVWNNIDPSVIPVLNVLRTSDGREYISMKAEGKDRPYFVKGSIYIRCGEENRRATHHEAKMMLRASEDCLSESISINQDLTFSDLCIRLRALGMDVTDDEYFHRSLGLVNSNRQFSMQAELLSDQNRSPLTVVVFNGLDRTCISYRTEYSKCSIITEMVNVQNFVNSLNECAVVVSSGERTERHLFDFEAFKEAWANACIHNNWLSTIPPTVHIFDDRLEIISYGSLPYGLTLDDFFNGVSMPVNESLMRTFIMSRISEHNGHGIPKIVKSYGKDAFLISPGSVRVTLKFTRNRMAASSRETESKLTEKELLVYDALKTNPSFTVKEISEFTGVSIAQTARTISILQERKVLIREGSKRSGKWVVVRDIQR